MFRIKGSIEYLVNWFRHLTRRFQNPLSGGEAGRSG